MVREVDPAAVRLEVQTAPWDSSYYGGSGYPWAQRDDIRARVLLRSGSAPSEARLWVHRPAGAAAGYVTVMEGETRSTQTMPGALGLTIAPHGLKEWDFVRVLAEGYGRPVFLGMITGWRWNRRAGRMEVIAKDFRVLLRRIKCRGARFYRPAAADTVFIDDLGPHFGADGLPDLLYAPSEGAGYIERFTVPGCQNLPAAGDLAAHWSPGDALNCLRDLFTVTKPAALDAVDKFLTWPQATTTGDWSWLYEDPDSGDPRIVSDLDCRGRSLAWAIDQIVSAAGPYDWTLRYTAEDKAELSIFPVCTDSVDGNLSLGCSGGGIAADPPDVYDSDLELDWSEAYGEVRAVGARKRIDLTLTLTPHASSDSPAVAAASQLAPLWDGTPQGTWIALADDSPEKNGQGYQDVFCSFGAVDDLDWSTWLGTVYREGPRPAEALLASQMLAEAEATGRPIRISARIWRQKGGTWEPLPDSIGVSILPDRAGIRLSASARDGRERAEGAGAETWSWYMDTTHPKLYPLRVTLCFEADERLYDSATDTVDWPAGELYLPAGDRYRYDARISCWLRWDGSKPIVNGGSDHEFGSGTPDVVRDNSDELAALADRKLKQVSVPFVH